MHGSELTAVLSVIPTVIAVIGAIYVRIKMLPKWLDHAKLIARTTAAEERADDAEGRATRAEEAARNYQLSVDGWQKRFEELSSELADVKDAVDDLRHKNALQTQYLCEVLLAVRAGTPVPEIPAELRDDIEQGLKAAPPS